MSKLSVLGSKLRKKLGKGEQISADKAELESYISGMSDAISQFMDGLDKIILKDKWDKIDNILSEIKRQDDHTEEFLNRK